MRIRKFLSWIEFCFSGNWNSCSRGLILYGLESLGGRKPCKGWCTLVTMRLNKATSTALHNSKKVGNPSGLGLNPHQEGDVYKSLDSAVARNTVCRSSSFIPWVRRMRSAYKARADDEITSEMWCSIENCSVNVTPNNLRLDTRRISGSSSEPESFTAIIPTAVIPR